MTVSRSLLLLFITVLAPPVQAQNLIHLWDFDSDGIVNDRGTTAGRDGTLVGAATVTGGILRLNGSTGYVQLDRNFVPTSPSYTVALFVRAEAGSNTGASRDFISQGSAGAAFYIGATVSGAQIRAGDNWAEVAGASFIADGLFHHYALTMSPEGGVFFVDGMQVATNAPFAGGAGGTATRLGRGAGDSGGYFSGDLDDVRIYDDALGPEQIQELARGSLLTKSSKQ